MRRSLPRIFRRAALVPVLAAPLCADVIVYDGSGAGFTSLATIVQAAQDGDTIVVRGNHLPFRIDGKSLTVIADGPVFLDGSNSHGAGRTTITVQNLAAGQHVVVRGFRTNFGVKVSDCEGAVWLDDIQCSGGASICTSGVAAGLVVERSAAVTVTRSSFVGETGSFVLFPPTLVSPGLLATEAGVTLFDCVLSGGVGIDASPGTSALAGAAGARLDGSTLTLSGSSLVGGGGGIDSFDPCGGMHAPGGPGLELVGAPSTVRSTESTAVGGVRSLEPLCPGRSGPAGPAIVGTGTILPQPGYARHLRASSPVRGGEDVSFTVEGQPGETPWLVASQEHAPAWLASFTGVLLVSVPPEELLVLPTLPASGTATLTFPVPNVGLAVGALTYHVQAVFLDPAPRVWLGAGTTVVLLDASY